MSNVNFPDVDVRQRLGEAAGYGVAEIHVDEGTSIDGVTLADAGLRDRDITVLVVENDHGVIPNPSSDRILHAGDRLLCFGNLEQMRSLIPARRKRRAKVAVLPEEPLQTEDGVEESG